MKVGDSIKFWSNRVFGVPISAKVCRIYKNGNKVAVLAYYHGITWKTTIHPARILN